jgi:hypothetical protein
MDQERALKMVPRLNSRFIGVSGFAVIVGKCSCENDTPLTLMLIPGAPLSITCGVCRTMYSARSFNFDSRKIKEGIDFGVDTAVPDIIVPS